MKRLIFASVLAAGVLLAGLSGPANATVLTAPAPNSLYIPFPTVNYQGPGPQYFGAGTFHVTWTSSNATRNGGAVFGWDGYYGFASNGSVQGVPLIGLNDRAVYWDVGHDYMRLKFNRMVTTFVTRLNWVPSDGTNYVVYGPDICDSQGNCPNIDILHLDDPRYPPPLPHDQFYGFAEPGGFNGIDFTDGYLAAIGGIYVTMVPEPAAWTMLVLGVGLTGFALRRSRIKVAA